MTKSPQEAYKSGYTNGVFMAEKMRWQGTPIGNFLKSSPYRPDEDYRSAYDAGFRRAMEDAFRGNWTPPCREPWEKEKFANCKKMKNEIKKNKIFFFMDRKDHMNLTESQFILVIKMR